MTPTKDVATLNEWQKTRDAFDSYVAWLRRSEDADPNWSQYISLDLLNVTAK